MSKDDNDEAEKKSASLASTRDPNINSTNEEGQKRRMSATGRIADNSLLREARLGMGSQNMLGMTGMASKIAAMGLMENHALKAARFGMDYQDKLGLTRMASINKIAAMGLTENYALKAARFGFDIQEKLGLTGMASKIATMGLTDNHALKAARLGMDFQDKLGLTGIASKVAAMGLTNSHAFKDSMFGMDIQKNRGMFGLASKVAAMGLSDNLALKASMLGMDIQKNLGVVGLASKIAAMSLTENPALKATMFGLNFQNREMFGLASKVIAAGLPYKSFIGNHATAKDLLASPEVEKAFSHLIDEDDFEITAKQMYLDSSSTSIAPDGTIEIQPFNPNSSFMEWYDKLNPISKHAITALFAILLSIIANLLTPFVGNLIHAQKHETKAMIKTIKNSNNVSITIDKQYRFVSATKLPVRKKPKKDSAIIATTTLGKVVSVDDKKRGWAKISYLDENEDIIIGWVLLRYVSNFKK